MGSWKFNAQEVWLEREEFGEALMGDFRMTAEFSAVVSRCSSVVQVFDCCSVQRQRGVHDFCVLALLRQNIVHFFMN